MKQRQRATYVFTSQHSRVITFLTLLRYSCNRISLILPQYCCTQSPHATIRSGVSFRGDNYVFKMRTVVTVAYVMVTEEIPCDGSFECTGYWRFSSIISGNGGGEDREVTGIFLIRSKKDRLKEILPLIDKYDFNSGNNVYYSSNLYCFDIFLSFAESHSKTDTLDTA